MAPYQDRYKKMSDIVCSICLESILNDPYHLPCAHQYHTDCFVKYLEYKIERQESINCPCCRKPFEVICQVHTLDNSSFQETNCIYCDKFVLKFLLLASSIIIIGSMLLTMVLWNKKMKVDL